MAEAIKPNEPDGKTPKPAMQRMLLEFFGYLAKGNSATFAANNVKGLNIRVARTWREKNADVSQRWAEALDKGADFLEDKALEFVTEGIVEFESTTTTTAKDGSVKETKIVRRRVSERLLEFQLKARRPSKYRERVDAIDPNTGSQGSSDNARQDIERRLNEIRSRTSGGPDSGGTVVPFRQQDTSGTGSS